MARPAGSKNKRTQDMIDFAEAEGRMSPAKAMIAYYMMNLDAFPAAKAAFPGMVAIKLAKRLKSLRAELGEEFATLDQDQIRAVCEYEVLEKMFPAMPRVVAMKESAPYCHSKLPALVQVDIEDNRVADRIIAAQARLAKQVVAAVQQQPKQEEPRDVTPRPNSPAAIIGRAGRSPGS